MRLADYVVQFLEQKKINTVFTVSGGGSIFLCDALYKPSHKKIDPPPLTVKTVLIFFFSKNWTT